MQMPDYRRTGQLNPVLSCNGPKTLILMCGFSRSGKTSWAKSQPYPVVSPDAIRLAIHGQRFQELAEDLVWATARTMVRSWFIYGYDTVIADATNVVRSARDLWRRLEWRTVIKHIDTPAEVCIERALKLGEDFMVPVIELQMRVWEPPGDDEELWDEPRERL